MSSTLPAGASCARKEFRTLVSLEEARAITRGLAIRPVAECVPLAAALGRVLARDVLAPRDVPPFTRSMMDGYAVRAADTEDADEERAVELRLVASAEAGRPARMAVGPGEAVE
ncbi:MAG: hypothetical protein H0V09_07415, partial [Gemmatimonadetes bacterium]|nr:hypothetical protein [Gemmatimonadota bacterium]